MGKTLRSAELCALPVWEDETQGPMQGPLRWLPWHTRYGFLGITGASLCGARAHTRKISYFSDGVIVHESLIGRIALPTFGVLLVSRADLPGAMLSTRIPPAHIGLFSGRNAISHRA